MAIRGLEKFVLEYIDTNLDTMQKYTEYHAIDCTRLMIVCLFHATGCTNKKQISTN